MNTPVNPVPTASTASTKEHVSEHIAAYAAKSAPAPRVSSASKPLDTAKVFMTGRSQAVRLPKAYRFDTQEVTIERQGDALVLRPIAPSMHWVDRLQAVLERFDFEPDFDLQRPEPLPQAAREELFA